MQGQHISLFTGMGMGDLAAEAFGFETVATAEIDPWNRKVLAQRFPAAKHFEDVKHVTAKSKHELGITSHDHHKPLLVSGGFPCQDLSNAGLGAGLEGERSGLYVELMRVVEEFQPEYVMIENVSILRSKGLHKLLNDLHHLGYDARWDLIPAAAVGAPHLRDRIWIGAVRRPEVFSPEGARKRTEGKLVGGVGPKGDGVFGIPPSDATGPNMLVRFPRSGSMIGPLVYQRPDKATVKACKAAVKRGEMLLPSPSAQEPGWANLIPLDSAGKTPAHPNQRFYDSETNRVLQKGVRQVAALFPDLKPASHPLLPTPAARDYKDTGYLRCVPDKSLLPRRIFGIENGLWPTPTASDGTGGPGTSPKRTGGKNLRTAINDSPLNPEYVEWMMGLPLGWTDPLTANDALRPFAGWSQEPAGVPRVARGVKDRSKRIKALGNGLVPQVFAVALNDLLNW